MEAVWPLVGVIIGALLSPFATFWFARFRERSDRKRDAYLKFLKAIAAASNLTDERAQQSAAVLLREANLEVAVYGSPAVVQKVRETMKYENLKQTGAQAAFSNVLTAIRRDVGSKVFAEQLDAIGDIFFAQRPTEKE